MWKRELLFFVFNTFDIFFNTPKKGILFDYRMAEILKSALVMIGSRKKENSATAVCLIMYGELKWSFGYGESRITPIISCSDCSLNALKCGWKAGFGIASNYQ